MYVCRVARDLIFGRSPVALACFDDWQIEVPKTGTKIDIPGFRQDPRLGNPQIHVNGRWRPSFFDGDFSLLELKRP
jgi:hypothetical protein